MCIQNIKKKSGLKCFAAEGYSSDSVTEIRINSLLEGCFAVILLQISCNSVSIACFVDIYHLYLVFDAFFFCIFFASSPIFSRSGHWVHQPLAHETKPFNSIYNFQKFYCSEKKIKSPNIFCLLTLQSTLHSLSRFFALVSKKEFEHSKEMPKNDQSFLSSIKLCFLQICYDKKK